MEQREKNALHNVDRNVANLGNSLDYFKQEVKRKLAAIEQNQSTILRNQQILSNTLQTILNEIRRR